MKRKRLWVILSVGLIIVLCSCLFIKLSAAAVKKMPPVIIRVDDIQDYAFRASQIFMLSESLLDRVPMSLSVISGCFGEDEEILQSVKMAIEVGSEITVHGWSHEDFSSLSLAEQSALLNMSKNRLESLFNNQVDVFVAPMFQFNNDTILALKDSGFHILSSSTSYSEPQVKEGMMWVPGTVNISEYSSTNETWNMKSLESLQSEISSSVGKYGFTVLVTHPQELITDGKLDQDKILIFRSLLTYLKKSYTISTFENIDENSIFPSK
jgi:hypothetical protein